VPANKPDVVVFVLAHVINTSEVVRFVCCDCPFDPDPTFDTLYSEVHQLSSVVLLKALGKKAGNKLMQYFLKAQQKES